MKRLAIVLILVAALLLAFAAPALAGAPPDGAPPGAAADGLKKATDKSPVQADLPLGSDVPTLPDQAAPPGPPF